MSLDFPWGSPGFQYFWIIRNLGFPRLDAAWEDCQSETGRFCGSWNEVSDLLSLCKTLGSLWGLQTSPSGPAGGTWALNGDVD